MISAPAVSVIMPAYCAATTICQSIDSVRRQTLANWELIIIDDGSTDDTAHLAESYARSDVRIRLIQQENAGPSAARNYGLRLAAAPIIAFLDADDCWAAERLNGMLARLESHPSAGVLFSRTRFVDSVTGRPGAISAHHEQLSAADLLAENPVCSTSNIVARLQVFRDCGLFAEGLNHAEDQEWLARVALDTRWTICGVDEEWFFYRSDPASQSSDVEAMHRGWQALIDRLGEAYPDEMLTAAQRARAPFHRYMARRALRAGQPEAALRYLAGGLSRDPSLLFRQPRRTALTLAGTLAALLPIPAVKELVAR